MSQRHSRSRSRRLQVKGESCDADLVLLRRCRARYSARGSFWTGRCRARRWRRSCRWRRRAPSGRQSPALAGRSTSSPAPRLPVSRPASPPASPPIRRARAPSSTVLSRRRSAEPWRGRRFAGSGEQLYAALGIAREDRPARLGQFARRISRRSARRCLLFFSSPCRASFGYPQWAHLGMFMQNVMLLAVERGLSTCAQEAWAAGCIRPSAGDVSAPG